MKKDNLGRELAIGDFVVLPDPWGYKTLELARVEGFTPKKAKVGHGKDFQLKLTTDASRMCRIPPGEVMEYLLRQ